MMRFVLQFNWHAFWQSVVVLVVLGGVAQALPASRYAPRIRRGLWLVIIFSPLLAPLLFLVANVTGWGIPWEKFTAWYYIKYIVYDPIDHVFSDLQAGGSILSLLALILLLLGYFGCATGAVCLIAADLWQDRRILFESLRFRLSHGSERMYHALCQKMGVPHTPELRCHRQEEQPSVIGVRGTVILLPFKHTTAKTEWDGILDDPQKVRCLVAHELAHVRYRDNLIRFLKDLMTVFVPFPVILLKAAGAIRRLTETTESCCDILALKRGGVSPSEYDDVIRQVYGMRGPESRLAGLRRLIVRHLGRLKMSIPWWVVPAVPVAFLLILPPLAGKGTIVDAMVNKVPAIVASEFHASLDGQPVTIRVSAGDMADMDLSDLQRLRSLRLSTQDVAVLPNGSSRTAVPVIELPQDWVRATRAGAVPVSIVAPPTTAPGRAAGTQLPLKFQLAFGGVDAPRPDPLLATVPSSVSVPNTKVPSAPSLPQLQTVPTPVAFPAPPSIPSIPQLPVLPPSVPLIPVLPSVPSIPQLPVLPPSVPSVPALPPTSAPTAPPTLPPSMPPSVPSIPVLPSVPSIPQLPVLPPSVPSVPALPPPPAPTAPPTPYRPPPTPTPSYTPPPPPPPRIR